MQQLVNLRNLTITERAHARGGLFRYYPLLQGEDGTPQNFYLQLSETYADFESPRHRHNFDQVRFQIEGDADFARDGVMERGAIGYFPEGVHYGPQSVAGESLTLVLQFGGASGSGYISEARLQQGIAELTKTGTFERGIYKTPRPEGGTRSQDGYEAVWEHINQRELRYPQNRYATPIFMRPAAFSWRPDPAVPGLDRKLLGSFSEAATTLSMLRLEAGVAIDVPPRTILFVVDGSGHCGVGDWERHSALYTGHDAASSLTADSGCELLEIRLPALWDTHRTPR